MNGFIPLAWLQLKHQKLRLFAAVMGIGFAVILIFIQLGFKALAEPLRPEYDPQCFCHGL